MFPSHWEVEGGWGGHLKLNWSHLHSQVLEVTTTTEKDDDSMKDMTDETKV